jgi:predicted enzyme related to lactoylglutathione lyase
VGRFAFAPGGRFPSMIKGLRTAIYPAPDLNRGKAWYARVFERQPYFDQPFYVGFAVGGFELGLIPDASPHKDGAKAMWGVDDLEKEVQRLRALGVSEIGPIVDVGEGIRVVDVTDPFGNVLGLIENPHFSKANVE